MRFSVSLVPVLRAVSHARRSILRRFARGLYALLALRVAARRPPDFVVGASAPGGAYLRRWYLLPRNRWLNVYLHQFLRDDDDRALHDHPWASLSLMLDGAYIEHTIAAGGIHRRELITEGALRLRSARHAHRIELVPWADEEPAPCEWDQDDDRTLASYSRGMPSPCWTLFITGPVTRRWGFHCPQQGWIDYVRFTRPGQTGETGAGCDA